MFKKPLLEGRHEMTGLVPTYERFCREQQEIRESTRARRAFVLTGPSELLGSPWHPANRIEEEP